MASPAELAPTPNDLVEIGQLQYGDEQYRLTVGRDAELVNQIIAGSQEDLMQRMVPKDARERFNDAGSFEDWYAKGRFLVALRDQQNELAAIVWFGPSSLNDQIDKLDDKSQRLGLPLSMQFSTPGDEVPEGCNDTFAIRVYEGHRDKTKPESEDASFARRFMGKAQFLYESARLGEGTPVERIWLETNVMEDGPDGEPKMNGAVFLYEKAGFVPVATYMNPDPTNREMRVIMVTGPYSTRSIGEFALGAGQPAPAEHTDA
jgi:ribosomal protein S18 acetylase RimI-like enzyme